MQRNRYRAPIVIVEDPADPRLAPYLGLRDHALRQRQEADGGPLAGVFVAEGDPVVERAARAGFRIISVLVDASRTEALPAGIPADTLVLAAARPVLERLTGMGVHRGALALCERRPLPSVDDVIDGARRIVVLEAVVNPTNLGLIARSAAGLGMDAMLLDPDCSDPLYRRAARVAMGEVYAFPYTRIDALPNGIAPLRARGFTLVGLTPDPGAPPLDELALGDGPVGLLLGTEATGLRPATLAACDLRGRIPMHRGVDSLNVGVAAALACFVLGRR
jgi:tRNA G18 (ribose-2'-O)-methylase SpoU